MDITFERRCRIYKEGKNNKYYVGMRYAIFIDCEYEGDLVLMRDVHGVSIKLETFKVYESMEIDYRDEGFMTESERLKLAAYELAKGYGAVCFSMSANV